MPLPLLLLFDSRLDNAHICPVQRPDVALCFQYNNATAREAVKQASPYKNDPNFSLFVYKGPNHVAYDHTNCITAKTLVK